MLLFLLHSLERSDLSGGRSGQDEISSFCGVGRTHVPRALKPLLNDGLIEEDLGRIHGISRRVKVYSLSPQGIEMAREIRSRLLIEGVSWKDESGKLHKGELSGAFSEVNSSLARSGMRTIPLSLLLTLKRSPLTWNDVLWLSNSIGSEEGSSICLPDGWSPMTPPARPEGPAGMDDAVQEVDSALAKLGMAVVIGGRGMGKRSMVLEWVQSSGKKALWLARKDDEGDICVEEGGYDTVVLLDADMIDLGVSLLKGAGPLLNDPRDDEWPSVFRDVPLIGIQEGELDMDLEGVVRAIGVDEGIYLARIRELGIPNDLGKVLFKALKGSPGSLNFLRSLSEDKLKEIAEGDPDISVMTVIMGTRKHCNVPSVPQKTHK